MRICGNRQLKTLPGLATRPTSARVREALFNIWQGEIAGTRWLDLCTGTGAIGAEALCRGAASVLGIEQSGRACTIIQQNWQQVARGEQTFEVLRADVVQRLKTLTGKQFDRIYFDPPYASNLYQPVLDIISQERLLAPTGELAVEHSPKLWVAQPTPTLKICRQKIYGNTAVTFYRTASESQLLPALVLHVGSEK